MITIEINLISLNIKCYMEADKTSARKYNVGQKQKKHGWAKAEKTMWAKSRKNMAGQKPKKQ